MDHQLTAGRARGISLVELMVVLVIVSILAAVAYPSYAESVKNSRRASAKAKMTEVAGRLEQFRSEGSGAATYTTTLTDLQYPAGVLYSENGGHTLTIGAGAQGIVTSFIISAVPVKPDAACGTLTLNNLGIFGPANC